jgi:hypothetical protein
MQISMKTLRNFWRRLQRPTPKTTLNEDGTIKSVDWIDSPLKGCPLKALNLPWRSKECLAYFRQVVKDKSDSRLPIPELTLTPKAAKVLNGP